MGSKTIMVVDDSATIRKIMQRELSKADHEVILAKNGMEALYKAKDNGRNRVELYSS